MKGKNTNKPLSGGRVELYDWVRLIATALVIIGHCAYLSIGAENGGVEYVLPDNVSPYFYTWIFEQIWFLSNWVYSYHMPLFFFLSGAVLAVRPAGDPVRFVKGKLRRLIVPYFVCGWLFMLPVKYLSGFYTRQGLLKAMLLLPTGGDSGHLWFLPALFWCMVVFVLIEKAMHRIQTDNPWLLLAVSGVLTLGCSCLPLDILMLRKGLGYLFWFALGYVFERKRAAFRPWGKSRVLTAWGLLLILTWVQRKYNIQMSFLSVLLGIGRICLLSKLCLMCFPGVLHTAAGEILNRNLFNIYLFHDPLEYVVLKIFFDYHLLTTGKGCVLYYFCRLVLVPVVSVCIGEGVRMAQQLANKRRITGRV